jgi:hypothetical protein
MRTFLFVLLVALSSMAFAGGYDLPKNKTLTQQHYERELLKDYRMTQALKQELRDTGRIAPKDYTDVYNMQQGYRYDGGYIREPYNMYGR